jgi:hypothetical protein
LASADEAVRVTRTIEMTRIDAQLAPTQRFASLRPRASVLQSSPPTPYRGTGRKWLTGVM